MKITNATVIPVTGFQGSRNDQMILGFMTQVRKWSLIPYPSTNENLTGNKKADRGFLTNTQFFNQFTFTLPSGENLSGSAAYNRLFNFKEDAPHLTAQDVTLSSAVNSTTQNTVWSVGMTNWPSQRWQVETKLPLTEEQMLTVATLLHDSNIPSGKSVQLQADAHIAGSYTWIG